VRVKRFKRKKMHYVTVNKRTPCNTASAIIDYKELVAGIARGTVKCSLDNDAKIGQII